LIKGNALESEEGKVSGSGLCYEKRAKVWLRTQDAFRMAPHLTACCLCTEPCPGSWPDCEVQQTLAVFIHFDSSSQRRRRTRGVDTFRVCCKYSEEITRQQAAFMTRVNLSSSVAAVFRTVILCCTLVLRTAMCLSVLLCSPLAPVLFQSGP
jgi:hypothetical protein